MGRNAYAILTGLFLLILGGLAVTVAIWLGHYNTPRLPYIVESPLPVSGLHPESTVYYRGVEIGKVNAINFAGLDGRTILARIEVNPDAPITRGTYASLRLQPLTGLAQIELNETSENREPLPTTDSDPAHIPLRPSLVDQVTEFGQNILQQIQELTSRLNSLLNDENRQRALQLLDSMNVLIRHLDVTVGELPTLRADLHNTATQINGLAADMQKTSASIRSLAENSQQLLSSGQQSARALATTTVPQINALLADLQVTAGHIRRLSAMVENDPQALLLGPPPPAPGPGEPGYREPR